MAEPVTTVAAPTQVEAPKPITVTPYYDDFSIFDAADEIKAEALGQTPPVVVVPPEPKADPAPVPPTFSDESYRRAMSFGLTPEEVQAHASEAELNRSLNIAERALQISRVAPAPVAPPPTPTAPVEAAPTTAALIDEFEKQGYEPQFVNLLKAMHKESETLRAELGKVAPVVQGVAQTVQQTAMSRQLADFDARVMALGEEFVPLLGKDPHDKLSPQSAEYKERGKLATKIAVLGAGYKAAGLPVPSEDDLFHEAKRAMYGDRSKDAASERAKAQVAEQLRQRNGQFAARPTSSHSQENPREEALRGIRERMKSLGATVDADNVDWTGHPSER